MEEFKSGASRRQSGRFKHVTWTARAVSAVAGTMMAGVLVAASPAAAQSSVDAEPVPPGKANSTAPEKAPDKAQGLGGHGKKKQQRIVRAVVESDGTLVPGQSFGAASATDLATGVYQVCFDVPITNGTYNATIGLPGNVGEAEPGEINVVGRIETDNCLYIQTFDSQGELADNGFHVTVAYSAKRGH